MNTPSRRYRITVTPVEGDGLPCLDRCSIEFQHTARDDWMRALESLQRVRGMNGDERAALAVGIGLLDALAQREPGRGEDLLAGLRPQLDELARKLQRRENLD